MKIPMLIAGVDGCRGGWLCLLRNTSSRKITVSVESSFASLVRRKPSPKVIAVDIPIGLWEKGDRECDNAARAMLGPGRRSSVFPPPPRSVLKAETYEQARKLSENANGKGLPKQSFAIVDKIREVDQWMSPRRQKRVREVHPEVSFSGLNQGAALEYSKKTKKGREERLQLLRPQFAQIDELLNQLDREWAAPDDLLDAAAALWTAKRIAARRECRLSSQALDDKGLRMEIVY